MQSFSEDNRSVPLDCLFVGMAGNGVRVNNKGGATCKNTEQVF